MKNLLKSLVPTCMLLVSVATAANANRQPDQQRLVQLQPLPPLIELGLGMIQESRAVVGACCCHSPFANLVGGDRIISVDGRKVDSIESLRRALSIARPKRSIEFMFVRGFHFGGQQTKKVIIKFPANWWVQVREGE